MYWMVVWVGLVYVADTRGSASDTYASTRTLPSLHHAVGITLPDKWPDPKELPLGENRVLECPTCHGIEDIDKKTLRQIDTHTKEFLRGGPYPKIELFCYRCHSAAVFERPNIHVMLDERGQIKEDHCTYCHQEVHLDRTQALTREKYALRQRPEVICYGCHRNTPHLNALEHQLAQPKKDMLKKIEESERDYGVLLPLTDQGRVMCSTCHTPHPYGVMTSRHHPAGKQVHEGAYLQSSTRFVDHPWSTVIEMDKRDRLEKWNVLMHDEASIYYQRVEKEALLRLPAKDGTLCLACHEFEE